MSLPTFQTDDLTVQLLQSAWSKALNPVIAIPMNNGVTLKRVALLAGSNTINHKLGRDLQGWIITRKRSAANIYDTQDSNQQQNLTLTLTSDAIVIVDIYVY